MLKRISVAILVFLSLVAMSRPVFALVGDVNGDGKVDMEDIVLVILAFGSYPGYPRWNPNADLNNDSKIDMCDIILVILNLG